MQALHLYESFSYDQHPQMMGEASIQLAAWQRMLPGREALGEVGCAWQETCPACTDPRRVCQPLSFLRHLSINIMMGEAGGPN